MSNKINQSSNLWYNKLARQKLLEFSQEYNPGIYHIHGNKNIFWVLLWNLQSVQDIQPTDLSLTLHFFSISDLFQMGLSFTLMMWFALLLPKPWAFLSSHGTQQIRQTSPSSRCAQWGQAEALPAFCCLMHPYNHPCSSRSRSWSFLPFLPLGLSFQGNQNSREGALVNSHLQVQLGYHQPTHVRPRLQSYLPW